MAQHRRPPVADKDFQVVIPTHRRVDRQVTLRELPAELRERTLLLASDWDEAKALRKKHKHELVWAVDDPTVDCIAKKRQWIIENVRADNVFQLDDDMYFFRRCNKEHREWQGAKSGKWVQTDAAKAKGITFLFKEPFPDVQKMRRWDFIKDQMVNKGVVHTCIASRLMNNYVRGDYKMVGRAMHAIGHNRRTLLKHGIRFDQVKFREDFNVTLHLLRLGYPNLILTNFVVNPLDYGSDGGCSEERTVKGSDRAAVKLASIHDPFVKVVDKEYKGSINRKEVIVYWSNAYASAKVKDRRIK